MSDRLKVLVVGTTPDYIDWIQQSCPDRVLFLTDADQRQRSTLPGPAPHEEILVDLTDEYKVLRTVRQHLAHHRMKIDGIACFD